MLRIHIPKKYIFENDIFVDILYDLERINKTNSYKFTCLSINNVYKDSQEPEF